MAEAEALHAAPAPPPPAPEAHSNEGYPKVVDPIDKYSALIVRGTIIGVGMVGVGLFLRNSRLFARFEHVSQIPKDIIRKELELKGRVREVLPSGELRVEHEPIIGLPSILRRKTSNQKGLLNIRLAGLDISKAGQQYITKDLRLNNKPVTFTVIKPSEESSDAMDADITVKKVADRRGVGVWERDTWVESLQSAPAQVLVYHVSKDVVLHGVKIAQGVDRMTSAYNRIKNKTTSK